MENHHVTQLEIDLSALKHNFHYLKNKTKRGTKTLAVVKAFSYGLEPVGIANELEKQGVDYFGVAYADEGIKLREQGITKPILVLHAQTFNYPLLVKYCLEPNIYSLHTLKEFSSFAKQENLTNYPIHLKFNSGLNRLGFNLEEVDELLKLVTKNQNIKVVSAFSHIAASEDLNEKEFTEGQIHTFDKITTKLRSKLTDPFTVHMSNTSGVINYPNAHFDMVRLGIGLYGFGNDAKETSNLKNVATLKSIISQIRKVPKGSSVSYNRGLITEKEEKIAIIPIGHADGFSRPLGCGNGYVTINGQKAYTAGNICMDMILVNVTEIDCKEGDEVIIFNNQQTVEEFATICNTISYEILTAIAQRIKRVFID
ncbi:alanine racemase [Wenyingzhuangia sp. 2_MG-2023]|uniref:alanine racemase n=1 Tax=Wenyingzhuangia sp. 2_MG-2023 TaxID=3062639 RepID=UPI0026E2B6F6|nr:alanine racemase [Wenyingzhuangia sp. 2_MG-2023]MDO6736522.1 alanine racemase [Wenyingzhuangia sp. 2_MG-2023]